MHKLSKPLSAAAMALVISSLVAGTAFADSPNHNKPGWGKGDKNHHHSGPPGQSNRPSDRFGHKHDISFEFHDLFDKISLFFHFHGDSE